MATQDIAPTGSKKKTVRKEKKLVTISASKAFGSGAGAPAGAHKLAVVSLLGMQE